VLVKNAPAINGEQALLLKRRFEVKVLDAAKRSGPLLMPLLELRFVARHQKTADAQVQPVVVFTGLQRLKFGWGVGFVACRSGVGCRRGGVRGCRGGVRRGRGGFRLGFAEQSAPNTKARERDNYRSGPGSASNAAERFHVGGG
jgi:hypothetical protein